MRDTLHATWEYYKGGEWWDCLRARHKPAARGGSRRLPEERSRAHKEDKEEVEDVAEVLKLLFCQMPKDAGEHANQWHPIILVRWLAYCDAWANNPNIFHIHCTCHNVLATHV